MHRSRALARRGWPIGVLITILATLFAYRWINRGPRFPTWVTASMTLDSRIREIEAECKSPQRDVINWEICDAGGKRYAWINYPGEYSAYDPETGHLVYYRTSERCDPTGPWFFPWLSEECGRTFRETGPPPPCGASHCDPEEWAVPCTPDQLSRLGCLNFASLKEALRK